MLSRCLGEDQFVIQEANCKCSFDAWKVPLHGTLECAADIYERKNMLMKYYKPWFDLIPLLFWHRLQIRSSNSPCSCITSRRRLHCRASQYLQSYWVWATNFIQIQHSSRESLRRVGEFRFSCAQTQSVVPTCFAPYRWCFPQAFNQSRPSQFLQC